MSSPNVMLSELIAALPRLVHYLPAGDLTIVGVTADSRQVKPGFLFVAVPGVNIDGHTFIPQAIAAGAVAVVGERAPSDVSAAGGLPSAFPYVHVPDAREALGWLSAAWWNFPSRTMVLAGITGTDGKTTTTNLLYAMLSAAGFEAGMISTVNAQIGNRSYDTGLHTTTPPAPETQRYLAQMVKAGTTHAVLETTSHGLAQHRLAGCEFDVAVVTNITHEHLDYHGSWDAYREAKAMLFKGLAKSRIKADQPKIAVLNRDDTSSYEYLRTIPADWQISYGVVREKMASSRLQPWADVTAHDIYFTSHVLAFTLQSPWGNVEIESPLVGEYNVSNILAAASAALALGVSPAAVAKGVAAVRCVPGRMERIDEGQPFTAIVDFAHTPNALRRALESARQWVGKDGRVIVAFGSAGLRDKVKRRMMGEVAGLYADLIVVTAEDPRTESLEAIMAETAAGLEAHGREEGVDFWRVADRGEAIRYAVTLAREGDVVLACGKGHEQSMCFGEQEYPWDDRKAMRLALQGETLDTLPTAKD